MAEKAEGADVIEIALTAPFGYGKDMVRIPQAAAAGDGLHPIEVQTRCSSCSPGALESRIGRHRVDLTDGAPATVARKDLITEISGIGTQAPLVHTVVAAEGSSPLREDLELAPTTEGTAVRPHGQVGTTDVTAGKCARKKHGSVTRIGQSSKSTSTGSMRGISQVSSF